MIPRLLPRRISLQPCILNRHAPLPKNPLLLQRHPIQPARILRPRGIHRPQHLHRLMHTLIHPLQLQLLRPELLPPEKLPRAMDRPMAQCAHAREL